MIRVFVPMDSAAVAVGADAVAAAVSAETERRRAPAALVRNGSRGLFWLEPLIEVETPAGRVGYGPARAEDVPGLFAADFLHGAPHKLCVGPIEQLPYLRGQERLNFARAGLTDPLSLEDYAAHDGFRGLRNALDLPPGEIVDRVLKSGLRGRGGAAFPAGIKWKTVLEQKDSPKFIVCNADEGDSGSYSDRMLMEGDPYCLLEGMTIAGLAVGAEQGFIYLRSEYPIAHAILNEAIRRAASQGYLGRNILGSGRRFDVEVRLGGGAYICGEETALLESLEGRRGVVRSKPPLPAVQGLFGKPTLVNNVITFGTIPIILDKGAAFYSGYGVGRSRGTLPMQLGGNVKRAGLVEKGFGVTLRELLYDYGGGSASGRPIRAVQVGGPLGAYLPESQFDTPIDYEAFAALRAMVGHGGIVAFDDTVNMAQMARYAMEFCALESCGKCTPCRIGSTRGVEVIDRIAAGQQPEQNTALLRDLCETMIGGSLCALGGMAPFPVLSVLEHFAADFKARGPKTNA